MRLVRVAILSIILIGREGPWIQLWWLFQLAAAEAEAEALRKELAARKGSPGAIQDLSKLKPAAPEKRIDGTGYRETLFSGPGKTTGMDISVYFPNLVYRKRLFCYIDIIQSAQILCSSY